MARKTKKEIKGDLERFYRFQAERLRRNLSFRKDNRKFYSICCIGNDINKRMEKIKEIELELYKKYNVWLPYPLVDSSDWDKLWTHFDKISIRIINCQPRFSMPKGKITKAKLEKFDRSIKIWDELKKRRPDEQIKRTLRDNKYLVLEIDTDMDIDIISKEIRDTILSLCKEKRKYNLNKLPIRKRLDKYFGYLKVYDKVELAKRNENLSWKKIANRFYKNDAGGLSYAIRKTKRDYERGKKSIDTIDTTNIDK